MNINFKSGNISIIISEDVNANWYALIRSPKENSTVGDFATKEECIEYVKQALEQNKDKYSHNDLQIVLSQLEVYLQKSKLKGKNIKAVILDGDGTLWECFTLYNNAKIEYAKYIQSLFPNDPKLKGKENIQKFVDMMDTVDGLVTNYAKLFSIDRFKSTMLYMYKIVAFKNNNYSKEDEEKVANKIDEILNKLDNTPIKLFPDAIQSLEMLKQQGFMLILYSFASKKKMSTMPSILKKYINLIIDKRGDVKDYKFVRKTIKQQYGLDIPYQSMITIGNSIKYDINPALELGMNAIFLKRPEETGKYVKIVDRDKLKDPNIPIFPTLLPAAMLISQTSIDNNKEQNADIDI